MRPLTPQTCPPRRPGTPGRSRWAWALILLSGCAGAPARTDVDALREELRSLRRENEALSTRVQALAGEVDLLTVRASRSGQPARPQAAGPQAAGPAAAPVEFDAGSEDVTSTAATSAVPPDLAVVKVAPTTPVRSPARSARGTRTAPPLPTAVSIQEPDPVRLEAALGRPGRRGLSAEAEQDLRQAQGQSGLARAHALEDFTGRYPQHPHADNALIEAATAYEGAGRDEAACALARRVVDEYPAGDAQSDALERLALCAARRGAGDEAQKLMARLRADFPGTPAAKRAEARSSHSPGRNGETVPREVPARSGP